MADLSHLRHAMNYVDFEHGCLDCVYSKHSTNYEGTITIVRGVNAAEMHGILREIELLGLTPGEVDDAVERLVMKRGRRPDRTSLVHGFLSMCVTPKFLYEAVEYALAARCGPE